MRGRRGAKHAEQQARADDRDCESPPDATAPRARGWDCSAPDRVYRHCHNRSPDESSLRGDRPLTDPTAVRPGLPRVSQSLLWIKSLRTLASTVCWRAGAVFVMTGELPEHRGGQLGRADVPRIFSTEASAAGTLRLHSAPRLRAAAFSGITPIKAQPPRHASTRGRTEPHATTQPQERLGPGAASVLRTCSGTAPPTTGRAAPFDPVLQTRSRRLGGLDVSTTAAAAPLAVRTWARSLRQSSASSEPRGTQPIRRPAGYSRASATASPTISVPATARAVGAPARSASHASGSEPSGIAPQVSR